MLISTFEHYRVAMIVIHIFYKLRLAKLSPRYQSLCVEKCTDGKSNEAIAAVKPEDVIFLSLDTSYS